MRVAIYARLSKDLDGTQTATSRQRKDCKAFAGIKGWTVVETFEDVDFSAYRKGDARPGYNALLAAVAAGDVDAQLVVGEVVWDRRAGQRSRAAGHGITEQWHQLAGGIEGFLEVTNRLALRW